jgi:hypothetical protein
MKILNISIKLTTLITIVRFIVAKTFIGKIIFFFLVIINYKYYKNLM